MKQPFPDPSWADAAPMCIACGYSLVGLAAPGVCPECGAMFESRHMVLCGVPRRTVTSPYRRAAWAVVLLAAVGFSQTFPLLILAVSGWITLATLIAILGALALLVATGPRERHGAERFLIARSGIARIPLAAAPGGARPEGNWIPWADADTVELRRVSPNWKRLRIGRRGPHGRLTTTVFEAGIRCPDVSVDEVVSTIRSFLRPGA